jgi:hypothetical protein
MPTPREREYYRMGFRDGWSQGTAGTGRGTYSEVMGETPITFASAGRTTAPKRKLSAWNKYVKANSKKPRFRYRNGKLNLKKMAVAFRKTPAGRKKRR